MKRILFFLAFLCVENFAQAVIFPVAPLGQNNVWVYEDILSLRQSANSKKEKNINANEKLYFSRYI